MIKKIAIGVAALIILPLVAILAFAATKPDTFRVERAITIAAPPEKIFPYINDVEKGPLWSPWENKDPNMKRHYSGPKQGKGAVYEWEGNRDVGKGRLEIVESSPPNKVVSKLDMVEPMMASNTVMFTLEPEGGATKVTWEMRGPSPYMAKVMDTIFNMERMVGNDFEAGLASLKALAEK